VTRWWQDLVAIDIGNASSIMSLDGRRCIPGIPAARTACTRYTLMHRISYIMLTNIRLYPLYLIVLTTTTTPSAQS
jgi:hypothetical protein